MDTPEKDKLEARKITSIAMKNEKFLETQASGLEEKQKSLLEELEELSTEENSYVSTSNLLQVRTTALSVIEEEKNPKQEEKPEKTVHEFLYGEVMGDRANIDRTRAEKKVDKKG
ncbi:MAG: hypothetical protein R3Y63_00545 [Eubacteriales bacterium]